MILIISTCKNKLSEEEFVKPIERIVSKKFHTKHYTEKFDSNEYDKIIICGTSLKDFAYIDDLKMFSWLKNYKGKVLGICSGAQIIACVFGQSLKSETIIGSREVSITTKNSIANGRFKSYFLISKKIMFGDEFVSLAENEYAFRRNEMYGLLFHPEVLSPEIVDSFCAL
jgi:GMP synthase-like glutamine amidotransferase